MASISALRSYLNGLPQGYQLHWYTIEQVIGQGAFGITYLAEDVNLSRKVAIKEYMPAQLAIRAEDQTAQPVSLEDAEKYFWGKDRFLNEARLLADVEHPSIVQVLSVFEANNTAYMVMQYERGESLDNILKRHGTLNQSQLLEVLYPIMEGLDYIHSRRIIHRDIKPGNIYIREDGPPVLLDFGSARRSLQTRTARLTSLVTPGYAPIEQYGARANKQGPWTDIYGLGATLHRSITGSPPPDAINRSESISTEAKDTYCPSETRTEYEFSPALIAAIQQALTFRPQDRPQSIGEWRKTFEPELLAGSNPTQALFTMGSLTERPDIREATTGQFEEMFPRENNIDPYRRTKNISRFWFAAMLVLTITVVGRYVVDSYRKVDHTSAQVAGLPGIENSPIFSEFLADTLGGPLDQLTNNSGLPLNLTLPAPELMSLSEVSPDNDETIATLLPNLDSMTANDERAPKPSLRQLLSAAKSDLRAERLTRPAGDNALEKFRAALLIDPDNAEAKNGLEEIITSYASLVDKALLEQRFTEAEKLIDRAKGISPQSELVKNAENALKIAQFDYAINNIAPPIIEDESPSLASVETKREVHDSVKRGDAFIQQISGEN